MHLHANYCQRLTCFMSSVSVNLIALFMMLVSSGSVRYMQIAFVDKRWAESARLNSRLCLSCSRRVCHRSVAPCQIQVTILKAHLNNCSLLQAVVVIFTWFWNPFLDNSFHPPFSFYSVQHWGFVCSFTYNMDSSTRSSSLSSDLTTTTESSLVSLCLLMKDTASDADIYSQCQSSFFARFPQEVRNSIYGYLLNASIETESSSMCMCGTCTRISRHVNDGTAIYVEESVTLPSNYWYVTDGRSDENLPEISILSKNKVAWKSPKLCGGRKDQISKTLRAISTHGPHGFNCRMVNQECDPCFQTWHKYEYDHLRFVCRRFYDEVRPYYIRYRIATHQPLLSTKSVHKQMLHAQRGVTIARGMCQNLKPTIKTATFGFDFQSTAGGLAPCRPWLAFYSFYYLIWRWFGDSGPFHLENLILRFRLTGEPDLLDFVPLIKALGRLHSVKNVRFVINGCENSHSPIWKALIRLMKKAATRHPDYTASTSAWDLFAPVAALRNSMYSHQDEVRASRAWLLDTLLDTDFQYELINPSFEGITYFNYTKERGLHVDNLVAICNTYTFNVATHYLSLCFVPRRELDACLEDCLDCSNESFASHRLNFDLELYLQLDMDSSRVRNQVDRYDLLFQPLKILGFHYFNNNWADIGGVYVKPYIANEPRFPAKLCPRSILTLAVTPLPILLVRGWVVKLNGFCKCCVTAKWADSRSCLGPYFCLKLVPPNVVDIAHVS